MTDNSKERPWRSPLVIAAIIAGLASIITGLITSRAFTEFGATDPDATRAQTLKEAIHKDLTDISSIAESWSTAIKEKNIAREKELRADLGVALANWQDEAVPRTEAINTAFGPTAALLFRDDDNPLVFTLEPCGIATPIDNKADMASCEELFYSEAETLENIRTAPWLKKPTVFQHLIPVNSIVPHDIHTSLSLLRKTVQFHYDCAEQQSTGVRPDLVCPKGERSTQFMVDRRRDILAGRRDALLKALSPENLR